MQKNGIERGFEEYKRAAYRQQDKRKISCEEKTERELMILHSDFCILRFLSAH